MGVFDKPGRIETLTERVLAIGIATCPQGHHDCTVEEHFIVPVKRWLRVGGDPFSYGCDACKAGVCRKHAPDQWTSEPRTKREASQRIRAVVGDQVARAVDLERTRLIRVWLSADTQERNDAFREWQAKTHGRPAVGRGIVHVSPARKRRPKPSKQARRAKGFLGQLMRPRPEQRSEQARAWSDREVTRGYKVLSYGVEPLTAKPFALVRVYGLDPIGLRVELPEVDRRVQGRYWERAIRQAVTAYLH